MLSDKVIGLSIEQDFNYTWRDVALYNIAVGAGKDDLPYVYEKELKVIPTFAVVPCTAVFGVEPYTGFADMPTSHVEGIVMDGSVAMDHKLVISRPLKTEEKLHIVKSISDLFDRGEGRGVKFNEDVVGYDADGKEVFRNTVGSLKRFGGGFGGKPVPRPAFAMPDREADIELPGAVPENAAVLYRLTGDLNNIHVDPAAAKAAGMGVPVLQGLCTLGYACRMMIGELFPGEPERMLSIENQFRAALYPGQAFTLKIWKEGPGEALFRVCVEGRDRDGNAVIRNAIDYGRMTWKVS